MKSTEQNQIEQSLLHNGLDFILEGLLYLGKENKAKYGLLNIYSGTLLILKERLLQEHWTLLFRPKVEADWDKFVAGDFPSVNFEESIKRLKNVLKIEFDEKFESEFENIRRNRNKIEHFKNNISNEALESLASKAIVHTLNFIDKYLIANDFDDDEQKTLQAIREKLNTNEALIKANSENARSLILDADTILTCYICEQQFLVVKDGANCKFCREKNDDPEDAAAKYFEKHSIYQPYHPKHNPDAREPIIDCPSCGSSQSYVLDENGSYTCFSCGETYDDGYWDECCECGTLISPQSDCQICSECFNYKVNKDD